MRDQLIRAGCFVAIILLGFILRLVGVFKESDFKVLSTITLKITLPASVIVNFAQMDLDPSMLTIMALGFGGGGGLRWSFWLLRR